MNAFLSGFRQDLTGSRINNLKIKLRTTIKFAEDSRNKNFIKDNVEEIAEIDNHSRAVLEREI